ncbi:MULTISPECIES: YidH family protein [Aerosakkonema]|uniref:YidH family protein n=1 Tax=Aerosakkonema TaxID=1246629 RepID=UPI0035B725C7
MNKTPNFDRLREHQANERTFLAWLRTSIALIGFGFAIARFGLFLRQLESAVTGHNIDSHSAINSQNLGLGLAILGIVLIGFSLWRYNQIFRQIENSDYQPSRLMVWLTAGIVMILGVLTIPFVLWRQPSVPKQPSSSKSSAARQNSLLYYDLAQKIERKNI